MHTLLAVLLPVLALFVYGNESQSLAEEEDALLSLISEQDGTREQGRDQASVGGLVCANGGTPAQYRQPIKNGCGSEAMLKNSIIKMASTELLGVYQDCCDAHDLCYGTYGKTQAECDAAFLSCNTGKCDAAYSGILKYVAKQACYAVKDSMQALVTGSLGVSAFSSDQQLNCCPCTTLKKSSVGATPSSFLLRSDQSGFSTCIYRQQVTAQYNQAKSLMGQWEICGLCDGEILGSGNGYTVKTTQSSGWGCSLQCA